MVGIDQPVEAEVVTTASGVCLELEPVPKLAFFLIVGLARALDMSVVRRHIQVVGVVVHCFGRDIFGVKSRELGQQLFNFLLGFK